MRKARATFSADFFGTAGFAIMGEFFFDNVAEAAKASTSSDADIVVMCASDTDYDEVGEQFAQAFRAAGTEQLLVLAGYPHRPAGSLEQGWCG